MFDLFFDQQINQEFRRARRRAITRKLLRPFRHEPASLLPFAEVRENIWMRGQRDLGIRTVPLDLIVGCEVRLWVL